MTPGGPKSHWEDLGVTPGGPKSHWEDLEVTPGPGGALGGPKGHWEDLGVTPAGPWGGTGRTLKWHWRTQGCNGRTYG